MKASLTLQRTWNGTDGIEQHTIELTIAEDPEAGDPHPTEVDAVNSEAMALLVRWLRTKGYKPR